MIKCRCTSCHRLLAVKEKLIGRTVPCPGCGHSFVIAAEGSFAGNGMETTRPAASEESANGATSEPTSGHEPATVTTSPPRPSTLLDRIGRFEIKAALGQGGFGSVYRAYDPVLDRDVAIKVPKPSAKGAAQLITEARTAAGLRHPNIVAVYEAGADGDEVFIATEYVEGRTLAEQAREQSVTPRLAAEWVKSLADGLAYAHEEEVVHRDVKPQNVMVGESRRAQLMDFGLASTLTDGESDRAGVSGTPAYMAPEQARGEGVGPAADQYSLGAVLYELLTGQPPFANGLETIGQVAENAAPRTPRLIKPLIPKDLEAICLKAMAADPSRRYEDCHALADDLGRFLNDELVTARNYSPLELLSHWARKRPGLLAWTAAAVCLVALLIGGGVAYGLHYVWRDGTTLASSVGADGGGAEAPKAGASTASVAAGDLDSEMIRYGRLLDRTRMAFAAGDVRLADYWLNQTRWDYRDWEYRYLRRIVDGGWKTIHAHRGEITAVAVHPAGTHAVSAGADGTVAVWELATGRKVRSAKCPERPTSLAYSPDGRTLAIALGAAETPMTMQAPTTAPPPPGIAAPKQASPKPAAEEKAPRYAVLVVEAESLRVKGEYREHKGAVATVAFSEDGTTVASGGADAPPKPGASPMRQLPAGELHLWDPATLKTTKTLKAPNGAVRSVAFLQGGKRVAAVSGPATFGEIAVWKLDPDAPPLNGSSGPTPAVASAPTPAPAPPNADPSMPETVYSGGYSAMEFLGGPMPQFVAAPGAGMMLLEGGRRRVNGRQGIVARQTSNAEDVAESRVPTSAIYALATSLEAGRFGQFAWAAAGGDALLASRPGGVTLFDPDYEFGGAVPHRGHTASATAVAFRPDGKQFVSGGADGVLKIWGAEVHPEVVKFGETRPAKRVAFGGDGRYVAVAVRSQSWTERRGAVTMFGPDGKPFVPPEKPRGAVRLYDVKDGRRLLDLAAGPGDVHALAVDRKLAWIAAGGDDAAVHVWDMVTGREKASLPAPGVVRAIAASADGKYLAAACEKPASEPNGSGSLVLWNLADDAKIASWNAHLKAALAVAFSPDGKLLASAGADQTVRLWTIDDRKEVRTFDAYAGEVTDLAFRPSGEELAGAGHDPCRPDQPGDAIIWSVADGKQRLKLTAKAGPMYGVAYSADGSRLATGGGAREGSLSKSGEVTVYDAQTGVELLPLVGAPGRESKTEAFPTTVCVQVTQMENRTIKEEKIVDGKKVVSEKVVCVPVSVPVMRTKLTSQRVEWESPGAVLGVAFSGDGRSLAAACEDGSALVWDAETCLPHDSIEWPSGRVLAVTGSPAGNLIAVAGDCLDDCNAAGVVCVYDAKTGRLVRRWETIADVPQHMGFLGDNQRLVVLARRHPSGEAKPVEPASATAQGNVLQTFDSRSGERVAELVVSDAAVERIAVQSTGDRVFAAIADGTVRQFDAATLKESHRWSDFGTVAALASSNDGRWVAAANGAGKVWIVDLSKGPDAKILTDQCAGVVALSFDDKGGRLLAAQRGDAKTDESAEYRVEESASSRLTVWNLERLGEPQSFAVGAPFDHAVIHGADAALGGVGAVTLASLDGAAVKLSFTQPRNPIRLASLSDSRLFTVASDRRVEGWRTDEAAARAGECSQCTTPRRPTIKFERVDPQLSLHRVRFAGDGSVAAVGGHKMRQTGPNIQHPVRQVDAKSGESRHTGGHHDVVRSVDVRPDGKQWASVGQDKNLYFWKPDGGSQPVDPLPDKVMKVVYSRDGTMVAAATAFNGLVILVDAETAKEIRRFKVEPMTAFALAFTPDGKRLVTGGLSGKIKVWEVESGKLAHEWDGHKGTIQTVVLSRNGKTLATCGHDKTVKLWDFQKREAVRTLEGFAGPAWDCSFSPDDAFLAVGAHDPVVRLYEVETGKTTKELPGHGDGVWSLAFSPDGVRLAVCGRQSPLVVWDWKKADRIARNDDAGECLAWHPDGTKLIAGSVFLRQPRQQKFDAIVSLHQPATGKIVDRIPFPEVSRPIFDVGKSGRFVALGKQDGVAVVWDRESKKIVSECKGHKGAILDVAFDPKQDRFATAGQDATVRIWTTGGKLAAALKHASSVTCVAFDPQGERLAAGDRDRTVSLWKTDAWSDAKATEPGTLKPERTLSGHYGELCAVSFNGDGGQLASTSRTYHGNSWKGDLKVWDAATGKRLLSRPSHTWWDAGVAFHPSQRMIATTGKDHTLQVFDARDGRLLTSIPTHGSMNSAVAFPPDGSRLLTILRGDACLIDVSSEDTRFGSGGSSAGEQDPKEAAAARWILENGGRVTVLVDGVAPIEINKAADLPSDPYLVHRVVFPAEANFNEVDLGKLKGLPALGHVRIDNQRLTDAGLATIAGISTVEELYVSNAKITDGGLAPLAKLTKLKVLHANDTALTGAGFQALAGLRTLQNVELHRTKLDDAGLDVVAGLPGIQTLGIAGTKVGDARVKDWKAKKPQLNIGR
jgi:WD40 repeat protein